MKLVLSLIVAVIYAFLLAYFGVAADRSEFIDLMMRYTVLFVAYLILINTYKSVKLRPIIILTVFLRLAFLFAEPRLSDDIYRFEWDARLTEHGFDVYERAPSQFTLEERSAIDPDNELYPYLNSKEYYSVYTPLNQVIFSTLSLFSGGSFKALLIVYHLFFILVDVLAAYLLFMSLKLLERPISESLIYLANPLLIIECSGNFHFESVVALFILLAVYLSLRSRHYLATLSFSAGAMLKLLPVILLPLALRFRSLKWIALSAVSVILLMLSLIPVFLGDVGQGGFMGSIDLYFRTFEFNASFYYLFREIGFLVSGYNQIALIGPLLSVVFVILTLSFSWFFPDRKSPTELFRDAALIYLTYFLLSTTVHPWYIIPLLLLGVLGRCRYPIVWSLLIFLSYSHYNDGSFSEQYSLIIVEYVLLMIAVLYEHRPKRKRGKGISVSP